MGRPNLTEVRTAEILDAMQACVAKHGLAGTSLEMVAETAGMKRSILRHYIGNRDDLILALANRVADSYHDDLDAMVESLADGRRIDGILEYLFPTTQRQTTESLLLLDSLIAASDEYPRIRELMFGYVERLISCVSEQLKITYPDASANDCWNVAFGVVSMCFNYESLLPLKLPPKYNRAAKDCCERLMGTLV